ncbi:MAG: hypothetical protein ACTSW1_02805 [Candidatus Hodarchaeales archaeon]
MDRFALKTRKIMTRLFLIAFSLMGSAGPQEVVYRSTYSEFRM